MIYFYSLLSEINMNPFFIRKFLLVMVCCLPPLVFAATYYVDNMNPKSNDNGIGQIDKPFKTIRQAIKGLAPGDTLYIATGVYRESIDLREAKVLKQSLYTGGMPLTKIMGIGAAPIINGADIVSNWLSLGNGVFAKPNWTINSQQVWINGESLQQIGGIIFGDYQNTPNHPLAKLNLSRGIWPGRIAGDQRNLIDNSFYYDDVQQILYIKVPDQTLEDKVVEVSGRPFLLFGEDIKNVLFQNLKFRYSNTTDFNPSGAITLLGNYLDLNGIQVEKVDGAGLDIAGDNNIVRNSAFNYCGQLGMKARGQNVKIIYNQANFNNTRSFNKWWEAGGMKFVGAGGLQDSVVVGNRTYSNNGDGIWFDWQNRNNKVYENRAAYNKGMGLHYEASYGGQILKNYIFANAQRGIYAPNSSDLLIANNFVAYNDLEAIVIVDERNAVEQNNMPLIPTRNYVFGNIIVANSSLTLVMPGKEIPDNRADANLYINTYGTPVFSLGWITRAKPAITGLTNWQTLSHLDLYSRQQFIPESASLMREFDELKPYPNFSTELNLALQFNLPLALIPSEIRSFVGKYPGP